MSSVSYIDSSGVASLVEAYQSARRGSTSFALVAVSDAAMRVLELAIECGSAYPERPPEMRFKTKVNLPFVKGDGTVDLKTLGVAQAWKRNNSIEDALNAVYHAMMRPECRRAPQPAEGTRY